jgi:OmpA-OmpF porin, OOP family
MFLRQLCFIIAMLFANLAFAAPADYTAEMAADADGAADTPLTGRYEGSTIVGQTFKKFDELTLPAGPADVKTKAFSKTVSQKGSVLRTLYVSPEQRSSLEVFGNYVDALKAKGFTAIFECDNAACGANFKDLKYKSNDPTRTVISEKAGTRRVFLSNGMFSKIVDPRYALLKKGDAGHETYVAVFAGQNSGGSFGDVSKALRSRVGVLIEVVEPGQREEKIVTLTADEIGNSIGADGRVVIYGLYFDFDKATIKPESQPQLDQMIAYLKGDASVQVYVVGHSDNKGELDYNLQLSTARAKSVVTALVGAGIDAGRLTAKGVGPLAPLASNKTDEGQSKNRRVELVGQ